jgi:pimeloyl-ACP methyl ester carboxylesterase
VIDNPGRPVDAGGVRLNVLDRGAGPAVVLLHGNPGSLLHFVPGVVDLLAPRFRVLALDRPGHGWSEPARDDPGSPVTQARLVHEAVRSLGVERAILVAESWSGSLALSYALEHPDEVAAVVGLAATFYPDPRLVEPLYRLLTAPVLGPALRATVAPALARRRIGARTPVGFAPLPVPPGYLELAEQLFTRPETMLAIARDALRRAEVVPELSGRYPEVRVPVLLVVGDADGTVDQRGQAHRLRAVLPSVELVELPQTGHLIAETRPEAVAEAVDRVASDAR